MMNATRLHDLCDLRTPIASAAVAASSVRLVDAEATLERARRRLYGRQRDAVLGCGDPLDLDQAVLEHREARATAAAARALWRQGLAGGRDGAPTDASAGPERPVECPADDPGPEVRFARWLVEAARLARPLSA